MENKRKHPPHDAAAVRKGEELDWQTLETYLKQHIDGLVGDMEVEQFHGGHANLTYLVRFGELELVVRRPPFGKIAPGAHDMKREYRVLSKLYQFLPQAPRAYHLCEDEDIIGAKFIVIERRSGLVIRKEIPSHFLDKESIYRRLTDALVTTLADLHKVDVKAAGLEHLGRPDGYAERQLKGWAHRWELSKTEENPAMDLVYETLTKAIPTPQTVSILHNDYKFDNCQFEYDNPDQVKSIFDWDMSTLGDPLFDLGTLLNYWPDLRFDPGKAGLPGAISGAFPSKQYVIEKYAEETGFDVSAIVWYHAFAYWKTAVVLQQLYRRYVNGETKDKRMAALGQGAIFFSNMAKLVIEGKGL